MKGGSQAEFGNPLMGLKQVEYIHKEQKLCLKIYVSVYGSG